MEVRLARTAGFCYGVERAVNAVCTELKEPHGQIYTYGPIVHNESVVGALEDEGVRVIWSFEELKELCESGSMSGATVIIRAHGVGREVMEILERPGYGIKCVDATCPFVRKIHNIVSSHYARGERIIITGTRSHPEVQGILGQIEGDAVVLSSLEEAEAFVPEKDARYCIVSQTTFNVEKFKDIVDFLRKRIYYENVVNTICNATELRQKEAYELGMACDAMIVIGGRNSSNTAKLYEICSRVCSLTYYIGSVNDLKDSFDNSVQCVGITAGASTPQNIIQEVLKYVREKF